MTMLAAGRAACLAALDHYELPGLANGSAAPPPEGLVAPLGAGLINQTFLVDTAALGQHPPVRAVLQRVNPLFGRAVNDDIYAITSHLRAAGLSTPLLYRTRDGQTAVDLGADGVWRLLTFEPGETFHKITPALAHQAGRLVARFHGALLGFPHRFAFTRPGAHDLDKHVATLRAAVAKAQAVADLPADFLPLATEILARVAEVPRELGGPLRLCHGDLKISNLLFLPASDGAGDGGGYVGHCLVDLDTMAYLPLGLELGDALRSWCNPDDENNPAGRFDLDLFTAALSGYAAGASGFVGAAEAGQLVPGTLRVTLQLAARFAADVVNQSYFGWDPTRFASRAEHNLIRARGQLSLARSLADQRRAADAVVARCFAAPDQDKDPPA
jgi:hypothetical protein